MSAPGGYRDLQLEQRLELYVAGMLPWDIEMTVEEPLSDDEDGVPPTKQTYECVGM
jgi:hypothetical protein